MKKLQKNRVTARTRLQYEAAECGAASLATILQYFGRVVELSELRKACGITRDGSNARQLLNAGRLYGLNARFYRCNGEELSRSGQFPCIVFWGFNHFLVVEGFDKLHAFLSDPAQGRVKVLMEEFLDKFTGIVLEFEPGPNFVMGGKQEDVLSFLPSILKPYRRPITSLLALASGQAILTLFIAGLTSSFIDNFLQDSLLYFGVPIVWLLLLAVLSLAALLTIQFVVLRRLQLLLSKRVTADLFRTLFKVSFAFYQTRFQGEVASRMLLGMQTTQVIVSQILKFSTSMWAGLIVIAFAFTISASLSFLCIALVTANLLFNTYLTRLRYDSNRKLAIEQGKSQGKGLQGINNIEAIKASGLETDFLAQWQGSFGSVVIQNQLLGSQLAYSSIAASGSAFLLNALVVSIGGLLIISGHMTIGSLVAFQFIQGQITQPINLLPQLSATLQRLIGDLGRLSDLLSNEPDPLVRSFNPIEDIVQGQDHRLSGSIELRSVSFGFSATDPPFIDNISLSIPRGSHLSIVGGSGSGKTTLIRLIAGLYQPLSGEILFDGKKWEDIPDNIIRGSLAYVPQQVFIFNTTMLNNITLWSSDYSNIELEQSAANAKILDTIQSHPEAFKRHLRDNGSDLSGGERQRLEICRALIRKPSILLLDEATSALDNATQTQVLDNIERLGMTLISIAHRLDIALRSDYVLFMKDGKVIESGSPDYLLSAKGYFYDLVQSEQANSEGIRS